MEAEAKTRITIEVEKIQQVDAGVRRPGAKNVRFDLVFRVDMSIGTKLEITILGCLAHRDADESINWKMAYKNGAFRVGKVSADLHDLVAGALAKNEMVQQLAVRMTTWKDENPKPEPQLNVWQS